MELEEMLAVNEEDGSLEFVLGELKVTLLGVEDNIIQFDKNEAYKAVEFIAEEFAEIIHNQMREYGYNRKDYHFSYEIQDVTFGSIVAIIKPVISFTNNVGNAIGTVTGILGCIFFLSGDLVETVTCYKNKNISCSIDFNTDGIITAYVDVVDGNSVSSIISDLGFSNFTNEQIAVALFEHNHRAFGNGDINVLYTGARLKVPSKNDILANNPYEAAVKYKLYRGRGFK